MSRTSIEWTHIPGTLPEVWNPVTGCNKVSQGCKNCYAEVMHKRLMHIMPSKYDQPFLEGAVTHEEMLKLPLTWKKPRTVFLNSMSDLFHENVPFEFIQKVLLVMFQCRDIHTFIILTKRVERVLLFEAWMVENINAFWFGFDKNVWIMASTEDQAACDERVPLLMKVTARVRGLSCEPLIATLKIPEEALQNKLDWVIAGGESGSNGRPMHPDWVRSLRDQCTAAGTPFFFKQWGEWKPYATNPITELIPLEVLSRKKKVFRNDKFENVPGSMPVEEAFLDYIFFKTGKSNSGHLLDGKVHHKFPQVTKQLLK